VTHHLEALPPWPADGSSDPLEPDDDLWEEFDALEDGTADPAPLVRPPWWRWVAIALIVSMVAAGPIAYVLSRLLS
jgi:hypothetical protein